MHKLALKSDGFTLIEVIIIIVIVSVFMAAIGIPLLNGIRDSDVPEKATTAFFLAQEKIEELAGTDYSSLTIGSWTLEDLGGDIGFVGYSRQVEVKNVDQDLADSGTDVGYRQITVTVFHSRIPNGIKVEALRTNY
jgi:prepilin-type N-terminal cleavage/methylation domain-containing protein